MASEFEQRPYTFVGMAEEQALFADNPDPRCPVVLLLDTSASMVGEPIRALNAGIRLFRDELLADPLAAKRVEVAIVSFGPVTTDVDFAAATEFDPPDLSPGGDTPMGRAIGVALDLLNRRKNSYRANGVPYYRPWVFLVTDGAPTDDWRAAAERVHAEEAAKRVAFFAVGVGTADLATLARITPREPIPLEGLRFQELFRWLSTSLSAVSRSQPGAEVALPPPRGWAAI